MIMGVILKQLVSLRNWAILLSKTGKATDKTEVFAYGAFLPEVVCGRRPMDIRGSVLNLVDWVIDFWKRGVILEASDPNLKNVQVVKEIGVGAETGIILFPP